MKVQNSVNKGGAETQGGMSQLAARPALLVWTKCKDKQTKVIGQAWKYLFNVPSREEFTALNHRLIRPLSLALTRPRSCQPRPSLLTGTDLTAAARSTCRSSYPHPSLHPLFKTPWFRANTRRLSRSPAVSSRISVARSSVVGISVKGTCRASDTCSSCSGGQAEF